MKKHHIALAITTLTVAVGIVGIAKGGTLPMHWNASGEVDRWGSKWELLIPMGMAIGFYLLFRFLEKHPEYSTLNVRKEVEKKGRALLADYSANMNVLIALIMLYATLTITTLLPFSPIMPIIIVIVMVGYSMFLTQSVRRLNRNAVKGESADETTVSMAEAETNYLANKQAPQNVWIYFFVPFTIIALLLTGVIVSHSADLLPLFSEKGYAEALATGKPLLGTLETIGYVVAIVVTIVNALIVTIVFRNYGRGEMFSAGNVRKMKYVEYSFMAMGIACLPLALLTGGAFYVIAVLALFIDFILKLFMHTFVKGYRMKEEQELTI